MTTKETPEITQSSLLPEARPEPYFEGVMEIADLLDRISIRWMDKGGELVLKVIPRSMVESVRKFGVINPITLTGDPHTSSGYTLLLAAGRGRLQAAISAGLTHIPVRIYDIAEVDTNALTIIENTHRGENIVAELDALRSVIEEARAAGSPITEKMLCETLNLNAQTVRRRLALGNLTPALLDGLRDGKIAQTVAEQAAKLPGAFQQVLEGVLAEKGTVTGDDVRQSRTVQTTAAALDIPDLAFATPDAPAAAAPATVYTVTSVTLKGEHFGASEGAFWKEQAAKDEANRLHELHPTYNYVVTPVTLR